MADTIRRVDYFTTKVPNRAGQAARILAGLAAAGVDLVPADSAKLRRAARAMDLALSKRKTGFLVQGGDRVGALTRIANTLAVGRVNLTAIDAVSAGKGRYGAIFWVKPASVARAAKLLRAR